MLRGRIFLWVTALAGCGSEKFTDAPSSSDGGDATASASDSGATATDASIDGGAVGPRDAGSMICEPAGDGGGLSCALGQEICCYGYSSTNFCLPKGQPCPVADAFPIECSADVHCSQIGYTDRVCCATFNSSGVLTSVDCLTSEACADDLRERVCTSTSDCDNDDSCAAVNVITRTCRD